MTNDASARLEAFFRARSDDPASLKVTDYEPIIGGYSRAMARVWVEDANGRRGYIVRADPPPGQSILDTDRAEEWAMLTALAARGTIPMPAPLWFDPTGEELGSPTIILEMIEGSSLIGAARAAQQSELRDLAFKMGEVASIIHRYDASELPDHLERPQVWDDYIEARIQEWVDGERAHVESDPFMRLIASWLRANKPPPAPLGLVHGDFQIANLLIDRDGRFLMVDWELAHIGDPREDLGWMALAAVTQPPDLIAGCEDEFFAHYARLAGLSDEVLNARTVAYFTLLAAATVFMPVIGQLGLLAEGGPAGITVAYMSNAVAGMHNVFMNTMAAHGQAGGAA